MCQWAGQLWCAAGAPVVQGLLVGLTAAATALAVYPFDVMLSRPPHGPMTAYSAATRSNTWARRLSWGLVPLVTATLGGYLLIYVNARGKFCDAQLDPTLRHTICWWAAITLLTATYFVSLAQLRRHIRRSAGDAARVGP